MGPSSVERSFRILVGMASGPAALWGFSPLRSLVIPGVVKVMDEQDGCGDGPRSGTSEVLSLVKASLNS